MEALNQFDVVIIGGGIVGLAMAKRCTQEGWSVLVVDQSAPDQVSVDQRQAKAWVSALNHQSIQCLQDMGVWQSLLDQSKTKVEFYQHLSVGQGNLSDQLTFSAQASSLDFLGAIVNNVEIKACLYASLSQLPGIEIKQDKPKHWSSEKRCLSLESGQVVQTQCLIGADGVNSWVRKAAGLKFNQDHLKQGAWVGLLQHSQRHQSTASQVFSPQGVMGCLPLFSPYESVLIASHQETKKDQMASFLMGEHSDWVSTHFPRLGSVKVASCQWRPINSGLASGFIGPGVALIGDAAVSVHPLAGLGLNLGLRSVNGLMANLTQGYRRKQLIGELEALDNYQRQHRAVAWAVKSGIKQCLSFSHGPESIRRLAHIGFTWLDQSQTIKKTMAQVVNGLWL